MVDFFVLFFYLLEIIKKKSQRMIIKVGYQKQSLEVVIKGGHVN